MKAFIGVDGSEGGWDAINQVVPLLSPGRDQVALYYSPPHFMFRHTDAPSQTSLKASRQNLGDCILDEAIARLPRGLQAQTEKIIGKQSPRRELVTAATRWGADLIVLGARGLSGIAGVLLGGVAQAVVRNSPIPVLIARKKHDKRSDGIYRVLLAIDEVPKSNDVVVSLERFHFPPQSEIRIIHAVSPLFGTELPEWFEKKTKHCTDEAITRAWQQDYQIEKREAFDHLSEWARQMPALFAGSAPLVLEGVPAAKIVETAQADDIDLLIVGTRDPRGWKRFLIGSTAEKLLQLSPCSVLVLHFGVVPD